MKSKYTTKNFKQKSLEKRFKELDQAGIELTIENIPKILNEMSFSIRNKKYPKDCPWYKTDPLQSCHSEIPESDLKEYEEINCFLCACPYYKSDQKQGGCNLHIGLGKEFEHSKGKIWDCSDCYLPNIPQGVKHYLERNMLELQKAYKKMKRKENIIKSFQNLKQKTSNLILSLKKK